MHGLYAWLRRHPWLVDGLLAFGVLAFGFGMFSAWLRAPVLVPLTVGLALPVVVRRAHPAGSFAAVILVGAVQVLWVRWPTGADLAVPILLYTLAAHRPRKDSLSGLGICLVGAAVAAVRWSSGHQHVTVSELAMAFSLLAAVVSLAWLLGDSTRWRRGYYHALEERAERLERERDALAQVAVATERARIAREMHDVVAHHVSVMVVQADGAAFALDDSPDKARQAMSAISRTGRQALTEMRRLLGVLRTADIGPAMLEPMPGVGELGDLVAQTEAGGIPVCVTVEGVPRPLDGGADLAAYRIVQESLTNVRKHGGPGVSVAITLRFCEEWLTIKVSDDGRGAAALGPTAPTAAVPAAGVSVAARSAAAARAGGAAGHAAEGSGHGLAGMRERVELYGGTVAAGPRQGGGFEVLARLPLRAVA